MQSVVLLICVLCLGGCFAPNARDMANKAQHEGGFVAQRFATSSFVLFGLLHPARMPEAEHSDVLHIYIEGDGFAWSSRTRPSTDPTPKNPVGLRLAQADPASGPILYLARPCQYVTGDDVRMCSPKDWTSARLSPVVLQSLHEAINMAKQRTGVKKIALVGYSGGGGAAALLAAQRTDVVFLGTVAGNLDHASWTRLHNVSPLHASLNPLDMASQLKGLPQRHMSGGNDDIVPPEISRRFCERVEDTSACVVVSGIAHEGSWERVWNFEYRVP